MALNPDQIKAIQKYAQQSANTFEAGVSPEEIAKQYATDLAALPENIRQEVEQVFANELNTNRPGVFDRFRQAYTTGSNVNVNAPTGNISTATGGTSGVTVPPSMNLVDGTGAGSVYVGSDTSNITTGTGATPDVTTEVSGPVGPTLGGDVPTIDVGATTDSGVRVSTPEETAGVTVDIPEVTPEEEAIAQFKAALPENMQADYQFIVDNPERFTADGQADVQAIADYLKDKGFSFEEAMQLTGLPADHPLFAEAQAAYGVSDEDVTSLVEDGSLSSGEGPTEATSGSIVPGAPQVGEVNILDYLGLQAGEPTLPMGTKLSSILAELEATDETLQALAPEEQLATGADYVASPQEITASTVTSPTAQDAVTATASTTDLVDQPEAAQMTAQKSLDQINKEADALQAARQDLSEIDPKATVQGQLALLQEQFADGEVPVWAQGAFRQVNALMAQRGIGGSTIAAEAITNALMQSALPIAQQDASFYQNVTIQNLSNEQQAEMAKFNARTTAIFNDQAAENAARSLNTQSENELAQFFAQLSQNVALTNTAQTNAMEQFNATAENQATQFFAELGLTAETFNADAINELATFDAEQANIIAQFNANMKNQREQFNVQNQLAIDASNVQWRRDVNTANTSAENAALQFDAQNLLAVQQTALNNIWQHYDQLLSFAFTSEESAKDRALNLTISSMNAEMQRQISEDSSFLDSITGIVGGAATILGSDTGFALAEKWGLV